MDKGEEGCPGPTWGLCMEKVDGQTFLDHNGTSAESTDTSQTLSFAEQSTITAQMWK